MSNVALLDNLNSAASLLESIARNLRYELEYDEEGVPTMWLNKAHDAGIRVSPSSNYYVISLYKPLMGTSETLIASNSTHGASSLITNYLVWDKSISGKTCMFSINKSSTEYHYLTTIIVTELDDGRVCVFIGNGKEVYIYHSGNMLTMPAPATSLTTAFVKAVSNDTNTILDEVYHCLYNIATISDGSKWAVGDRILRMVKVLGIDITE